VLVVTIVVEAGTPMHEGILDKTPSYRVEGGTPLYTSMSEGVLDGERGF